MATKAPAAISNEIASSTVSVRVPLWYCWVTSRARSMRSSLMLVAVVVGVACDRGVVSHSTSAHVAAAAAGRRTILIEGTSLTAGLGLDPDEAWPAVLQQRIDSEALPFVVVNAGLSGETSAGALRRIDWLLRGPVDVFVLETGANDGLRGLDPDSLRANMEAILAKVAAARPGAVLCVVQMEAPPNLGPAYSARFHAAFGEAARASGARLLPFLLSGVAGVPTLNQADGMHPTAAGARIAAATEWRALEPVLRSIDHTGKSM
jgi:acyl-CoA thioesterase-1